MSDDKPTPHPCSCTPAQLATGEHRHRCPAGPLAWIKLPDWFTAQRNQTNTEPAESAGHDEG